MTFWHQELFSLIDRMDMDGFLSRFSDDAWLRMGNQDKLVGKEAIKVAIGGFWDSIAGLTHNFERITETDDGVALFEANVEYDLLNGNKTNVFCVSAIKRNNEGLIEEYIIYGDFAPVFAG